MQTAFGHLSPTFRAWLLGGVVLASGLALTQAAHAQTAEADPPEQEASQVDEIIVTGTRRSLEDALATKRRETDIVDSISSEGIGRLPDLNLAESLQRVPGVQINRSAARRLGSVSIRGLPGGFAQTLINGQYLASPDVSNFSYGTVRSEVFSGIDVIKAQGADSITGGLSGLVNLRTGDPLAVSDSIGISLDQAYEEMTEEWSPGGALTFSRQFVPGVFGVRGAIGYKSANFRTDNAQINAYDRTAGAATPDNSDDVFRPREVRLPTQLVDNQSLSASFGAEWRPTDNLRAELFGFYNNFESETDSNEFLVSVQPTSTVTALSPASNDGAFGSTLSNLRILNPQVNVDTRVISEVFDTSALTGRLTWSDDVWSIAGTLHYTEANRESFNQGYQAILRSIAGGNGYAVDINTGAGDLGRFAFDLNPSAARLVNLQQIFGAPIAPTYREIRASNQTNASFLGGFRNDTEEESEFAVSLDIERVLDFGPISNVKVGGVYRDKSQSARQTLEGLFGARLSGLSNDFYNYSIFAGGAPYLDGGAGTFDIGDYGQFDVRRITAALTPVSGLPATGPYSIGPVGLVNFEDSTALAAIYDNEQQIYGGYAMVEFDEQLTDLIRFRGNLGVRYEKSERSTVASRQPQVLAFEYENTLPSANLIFEIGDDWQVRTSYTETLRRPQVDSFAVLRSVAVDGTGQIVTANLGAGDLLPFTSKNFDVSVEWYNRVGSSFSALLFQKEVEDYAGSTRACPLDGGGFGFGPLTLASGVCRTVNSTPAAGSFPTVLAGAAVNINVTANQDTFTLSGFELSAQQNLDFLPAPWNGLGGQINYTNVQFETDSTFRLGEISEDTFNAILYYETPRFGVRAAYNFRSEYFLASGGTQTGSDRMVKARPQLDISGSINLTDSATVAFEAFNVTDEDLFEFEGVEARIRNYFHYGRTYTVGLRYKF